MGTPILPKFTCMNAKPLIQLALLPAGEFNRGPTSPCTGKDPATAVGQLRPTSAILADQAEDGR